MTKVISLPLWGFWAIVASAFVWLIFILIAERIGYSTLVLKETFAAFTWFLRVWRTRSGGLSREGVLRDLAMERRLIETWAMRIMQIRPQPAWGPYVTAGLYHSGSIIGERMLGETKNPTDETILAGVRAYNAGVAMHVCRRDFARVHDSLSRLVLFAALPAGSPVLSKPKYRFFGAARPSLDHLQGEAQRLRPIRSSFSQAATVAMDRALARYSRLDLLRFVEEWSQLARAHQDPHLFFFVAVLCINQRNLARISRLGGPRARLARKMITRWARAIVHNDLRRQYETAVFVVAFLEASDPFRELGPSEEAA